MTPLNVEIKDRLLSAAVAANFKRLCDEEWQIHKIYDSRTSKSDPGDWVGRSMLAFNCLYEITGKEIPCMHQLLETIDDNSNEFKYLGDPFDGKILNERQISPHHWYLRGFVRYAQNFNSDKALAVAKSTFENLFLPARPWFETYPLERDNSTGGADGGDAGITGNWHLCTDTGSAFICIDGLSDYYRATKDERALPFLERLIEIFDGVDFVKYQFQTHATLTTLRGILRMYEITGNTKYLKMVEEKFERYQKHGMTLTYANFNWFGREDSWTEPCAVVDSFILAKKLYLITKKEHYLTLARRMWFNGLQFCQRPNGGAGTDTCVTETQRVLKMGIVYEAYVCCTMRYAEGLWECAQNQELFSWNENAPETVDDKNRHFVDDRLIVDWNGKRVPIFSCRDLASREEMERTQLII